MRRTHWEDPDKQAEPTPVSGKHGLCSQAALAGCYGPGEGCAPEARDQLLAQTPPRSERVFPGDSRNTLGEIS